MASGSKVWSIFSLAAALGAAAVAKKGITGTWRATTGKNPPANPADPDVDVWEAVAWAAVSGTLIGDRTDARHPQGRGLLREVHRPPAARAAEGRPGRRQGGRADQLTAVRRVSDSDSVRNA